MAKSKSYGGLIVFLIVIAGAAGGGWYYFRNKTEKAPEFQVTKIARGDITQAVTATGDLQPVVTVDIGAQVSGQIKEVLVDYNSIVKQGDVLARIDESTPTQRLRQAEADLASTEANNQLLKINAKRTTELFEKNLVSQQELDNINAQLAQSNASLLTRQAAVANAKLDLERTVITAPIDGMVLDRKTDKGRTVNASMNAPTLFTLVNNLSKMQINAAVAEADVGSISEGQEVKFTVDAFPNRTFTGSVRQVRNAATTQQSVVSYATIIDVNNEDLKLKPGMTANVSIIVQQKTNVLRVENGALRVRIPAELMPKAPAAVTPVIAKAGEKGAEKGKGGEKSAGTAATMTDEERMRATMDIMREVGFQRGTPASPEQIEKAKALAKEKGLDPDLIAARFATPGGRGGRGGGGGGGDGGRRGGGGGGGAGERGFNNTVVQRTLYKLVNPDAPDKDKRVEAVSARLGVSDGFYTEVLGGLNEGDTLVKGVIMPGAAPVAGAPAPGGSSNPFSGGRSFGGSSSGMRGR
ncbi:MAG: efflux RND transporter periplasmic adaptor subunit [Opitutaceae bacterium]|nr:efflux RND transporter periplasmic adaptor subunit [Opitutaceae bacterium]